jgi:hypothetical protein
MILAFAIFSRIGSTLPFSSGGRAVVLQFGIGRGKTWPDGAPTDILNRACACPVERRPSDPTGHPGAHAIEELLP